MSTTSVSTRQHAITDVYTDLHGMQQLNQEKDKNVALKKVAQQFESMFVQMMLKNMRQANAVFEKDSLINSEETHHYRDMYDKQLSLTLSHGRGLGIADAMYRQMTRQYSIPSDNGSLGTHGLLSDNRSLSDGKALNRSDIQFSSTSHALINKTLTNNLPSEVNNDRQNLLMNDTFTLNDAPIFTASSPQDFVNKLRPYAKKAANALGVDENMLIAQSALETGWGSKIITDAQGKLSNNLFNIKKGGDWLGHTVQKDTLEVDDGIATIERADFRSYESIEQSFTDYVNFIKNSDRYRHAIQDLSSNSIQKKSQVENKPDSVGRTRSVDYIKEIHRAGYATDPDYVNKVESVYDQILNMKNHGQRQSAGPIDNNVIHSG